MVQSLSHSKTLEPQSAVAEPTYTLMYRGVAHTKTRRPPATDSSEETNQLIGKRLSYRGTHYEIVSVKTTAPATDTIWKLCYRGVTYWSSKPTKQKAHEYMVVND